MTLISRVTNIAVVAGLLVFVASASTITDYATGVGPGGPVSVSASFTPGNQTIDVTLNNLLSNPTDVAQLISGLWFQIDNVSNPSGTLDDSSGTEISVISNEVGGFFVGSSVPTGWELSTLNGGLYLNVLGTATAPSHLIIGSPEAGAYSAAKGSIKDNGPHNPFLESGATFHISGLTGVSSSTTVSNVVFSFGTTQGGFELPCDDPDCGGGGGGGGQVPEPVSSALIGVGLLAIGIIRRRS